MLNYIILLVLLISFLGMSVIIRRKIPVLVDLDDSKIKRKGNTILDKTFRKVKNNGVVKNMDPKVLLHKGLFKFRVLSLKTEKKTSEWLKDLRQKSIEKKKSFEDDYWKKIKGEE